MITCQFNGRLGNNMIQYFISRYIADKNNFKLNTTFDKLENFFNIPKQTGNIQCENDKTIINDDNFIHFLQSPLDNKHYHLDGYFQDKIFLHHYSDYIKKLINPIYDDNIDKQNVFVAYRIGDINGLRQMLPKQYYEEALDMLDFDGGYITSETETINHPFVQELSKKYNLKPITFDEPIEKINFAKNFNQLVLSEGTFSWWIGFLSKAKNIIYNKRDWQWFGSNIFDFDEWIQLNWDYDSNNKPIKIIKN